MDYQITHKTEYHYAEPASLSYNEARVAPRSIDNLTFAQIVHGSKTVVTPSPDDYRERFDFFGNQVLYFTLRKPQSTITITAISQVTITPTLVKATLQAEQLLEQADDTPIWEDVRELLQHDLHPDTLEARQFVMNSPMVTVFPDLADYAKISFTSQRPIITAVYDLMTRIYDDFDFVPGVTTIATPLTKVLAEQRGVCQDYAHFMVGCLRSQGMAARYVSGYIETLPPPGEEKLVGADASHAWCSVYIPNLGWLDFDPTNNLIPTEQHIVLGWGRDFADVTPLKGVLFSHGKHKLHVSVDVARLDEQSKMVE